MRVNLGPTPNLLFVWDSFDFFNQQSKLVCAPDKDVLFSLKVIFVAISEFPKWSKYLILLSFQDNSSARSVQIGGWM